MKKTFTLIRFYLVWVFAAPLVLFYLIGAAIFSGQWLLVWIKFQLIHQSLYGKFIQEKQAAFPKLHHAKKPR